MQLIRSIVLSTLHLEASTASTTTSAPDNTDTTLIRDWHLQDVRSSLSDDFESWRIGSDPCAILCDEFSADLRGNGFDLCDDPRGSTCVPFSEFGFNVCTNLFWSSLDDGSPGLVYAINGENLPESETANPVTCADADRLVPGNSAFGPIADRSRIIELSGQLFAHLSPVRRLIDSPPTNTDDPLINIFRNRPNGYPSAEELENILGMGFNEVYEIMDVIEQLVHSSAVGISIQTGLASHRQCSSCGSESVSFQSIILPEHPLTVNGTVSLETLLNSMTNISFSMISYCDECHQHMVTQELRRVIQEAEVYVILIDPFFVGRIQHPPRLNMSRFASPDSAIGNHTYQLVAFADRWNEIGTLVNGTWVRSSNSVGDDHGLPSSGQPDAPIVSDRITALFYQRIV